MLADVREKLVRSVNVSVDINQVSSEFIESIDHFTVNDTGKILKFHIHDSESNTLVNLFSRKKHVVLTDEFMDYLQNSSGFEFRFA